MFYQVNDFIVLIHIALKDDTARDIVDHNDLVTLSTKKRLKLFQFSYTTWFFRYFWVSVKLFG